MKNFSKNIIDQVLEAQLKLGYEKEAMTLFYNEKGKRVAVTLSSSDVMYIHDNYKPSKFLVDLIEMTRNHDTKMEEILKLFKENGASIKRCGEKEQDELMADYIATYDGYVYLLKDDEGHISYHRFTENDFKNL